MKAKYIICEGNEAKSFECEPLSLDKCLQIYRVATAGKKWKGFRVMELSFGANGLTSISILK